MRWVCFIMVLILGATACDTDTQMAAPQVGDMAPDFELSDKDGRMVRLSDYRGKKNVVVYFYPKDETAGCTAQACAFRDSYEDFTDAGAEVIGISQDSATSHTRFAEHHRLPFVLLTDKGGTVSRQWGVQGLFSLIAGRVTFVIDREGRIVHRYDSQLRATNHITEALNALKEADAKVK